MYSHIVIGAGILGTSTAYHLAQQGANVLLVDRKEAGRATHVAAGIICPWMTQRRNKAWYRLANNGAHYYDTLIPELEAQGEQATGYRKVGAIALHETSKIEKMQTIAENRFPEAPGIQQIERLTAERVQTMFPLIEFVEDALFVTGGARVDGRALRAALERAARKHEATVVEGDAALVIVDGQVKGVQVDGEIHYADQIILTAGVWLNELLEPLDIQLDLRPEKGQILYLDLDAEQTEQWPVIMGQRGLYLVSNENGKLILGSTHEKQSDYNLQPTVKGMNALLSRALPVAPSLEETKINEIRVGLRPYTSNSLPIIGRLTGHANVLVANGLGASGLTIGPYLGRELARLALGESLDIDLEDYLPH